jgi:2-dehydro-3-deoxyglucarate aldolase/4-hydroxy-2-oxoheptanedioate aldolase
MKPNPVRSALAAGGTVYGSEISSFPCAEIPRLYAQAGFEFVFIDLEHTCFGLDRVAELIRAARATGIVPLVRVPQAEYAWVARVLDLGAQGVIVPRVDTAQQAADIVSWTHHPPRGIRGFGGVGAQTDGVPTRPRDLLDHLHEHTMVVIQLERGRAIAAADEIAAVPGVDVLCLGYMDLSVDLGVPGEMDHPRMVASIERMIAAARARGIAAGIISPDLAAVSAWVRRGIRFVSYSADGFLLARAAAEAAAAVRRPALADRAGARG